MPRLDDLLPPNSKDRPPAPPERSEPRGEARSTDRWGAVAYTADGAFGASYGIDNRTDAERLAVDECRREAVRQARLLERGVVTRQDTWFHIQFCRRGAEWTTQITTRSDAGRDQRGGGRLRAQSKFGADGCRMVPNGLFHSGGMHTKM